MRLELRTHQYNVMTLHHFWIFLCTLSMVEFSVPFFNPGFVLIFDSKRFNCISKTSIFVEEASNLSSTDAAKELRKRTDEETQLYIAGTVFDGGNGGNVVSPKDFTSSCCESYSEDRDRERTTVSTGCSFSLISTLRGGCCNWYSASISLLTFDLVHFQLSDSLEFF